MSADQPLIEVQDLTKVYKSRKRGPITAVGGISFSVGAGEVVGLLGPNGAGKTTTIKCMCTLILPSSGSIKIDGADAIKHPKSAVAKVAAVLEGNRNIYWRLTVKENLEFFAGLQGLSPKSVKDLIEQLIARFHLEDKAKAEARTLSRGMQQKLAVACAFVKQTPVLFLDEPTLGLDVETSYELRESLKEMAVSGGKTILLSSHDMDVVQSVCDRVIIINEGLIVTDDKVQNLLQLFKVRAYSFTLVGPMPQAQRDALLASFPGAIIEGDDRVTTVKVELNERSEIYDIVELLRKYDSVLESIDRQDPNLEEIFLRIVKGATV